MERFVRTLDKFEDVIRARLSHYPILYAIVGGVGIVMFWKGVWETAELFPLLFGPGSVIVGMVLLLSTGLMVSFFIGDSIILSGIAREKKLVEKTEEEVLEDHVTMTEVAERLARLEKMLTKPARKPRKTPSV